MRKKFLYYSFCIFFLFFSGKLFSQNIEVTMIWDKAPHSAFTDLIFFNDRYYCSFREGSGHVPGKEDVDGTVRIIMSEDGVHWESVAHLKADGYDLRDPKLSITPDNRLMVIIGGSDYDQLTLNGRQPHVSFSEDGLNFTDPQPVVIDPEIDSGMDWIWRVTWHEGIGYAVDYQFGTVNRAYVLKTTDGIHYENVSELFISGKPNEATIRFSPEGRMFIYLRRERQGQESLLLKSNFPYKEFTWVNLKHRLGGPNFIFLPNTDKLILGTRLYSDTGPTTGLFLSDYHGKHKLIAEFPSGGDTSYPGLLWHDDYLWISYYSSHEEKTSIYLAKIKQSDIYLSIQDK